MKKDFNQKRQSMPTLQKNSVTSRRSRGISWIPWFRNSISQQSLEDAYWKFCSFISNSYECHWKMIWTLYTRQMCKTFLGVKSIFPQSRPFLKRNKLTLYCRIYGDHIADLCKAFLLWVLCIIRVIHCSVDILMAELI